jgi:hypothetical protein
MAKIAPGCRQVEACQKGNAHYIGKTSNSRKALPHSVESFTSAAVNGALLIHQYRLSFDRHPSRKTVTFKAANHSL